MAAQGCSAPSACPDNDTLNKYWAVAQQKAQGLEPVYPEGWLLDAKAALDLGKFGVKLITGSGAGSMGSLNALADLGKANSQVARAVDISALPKHQAQALADLGEGSLKTGWTPQRVFEDVILAPKGSRPLPETYMTQQEINASLRPFEDGVTKIKAASPAGTEGPPGGTFVMPKAEADRIIKEAGGSTAKLEDLLGLSRGTLGANPVRVDIPKPTGLRMPSGNELGTNNQWVPGGKTSGGIAEATVDPVPKGGYTVRSISFK